MTSFTAKSSGRQWLYTAEQIERVLAYTGTIEGAAKAAKVPVEAARNWRNGVVPRYYVPTKPHVADAEIERRAARFYNPKDARSGR